MLKDRTIFDYREITLQPGEVRPIFALAKFFYLIENSISTSLTVQFDDQSPSPIPEGLSVEMEEPFEKITFVNTSAGVATLKFALSNGVIQNNNTLISGSINADATATDIDTPAPVVANAAGITIAGDAAQKELVLFNNGSVAVYWGESTVNIDPATFRGTRLPPNQGIVISTNAAVALKSSGVDCIISVNRLRKP